ncbi:WhiB family transcriptional regulator [Actinotalea fermentans]|uniref:4Fe-4S Wbl-type domain-containing protein n=1 Tax=Actinotalea fermentans TaxID=43671 RepID=A0A511YU36_9CELL|nr:WhiB family transcriptional regulator [Actinotalea fermentans]GEN78707.1 hypothetical protein AFE02nite_04410 [Actinotalea fermentans]
MSADRAEARRALLDLLDAHDTAGRPIPCRQDPDPAWTSDEPEDQAVAARLCARCPALDQCRAYGTAFPKECGVYGGETEFDRRKRARKAG